MTTKLHTPNPLLATLLAVLAGMPAAFAVAPVDPPAIYREGEVLVRYRAGVSGAQTQALHGKLGLLTKRRMARGRTELLRLPAVTTTAAALALLKDDPAVELAEPNFLRYPRINCPDNAGFFCPNDTLFAQQWGVRSTGQPNFASTDPALASIPGADMDMLLAWDPGADGTFERVGSSSVVIAIIDDGVHNHPDLVDNLIPGFDFEGNDTVTVPNSGGGHGTFVAGSAGARGNNSQGVAGTAWNAKLMPLKFGFDTADHVAAMEFAHDYVVANPAQRVIINASFGGPFFSQLEADAIQDLASDGILYVASAGNDDSNTDVAELNYPANHAATNIVAVAATNRQDTIASFSQYGAISTDVAAPGLQVVTTSGATSYATGNDCLAGGSCGATGTSFSSPYTAGVAALILSEHPGATVSEVKARLIEGAEDGDEVNLRTAGGRVNAAQSLDLAPRPALVISAVTYVDGNNQTLDPGEPLQVEVTIENLWQNATAVSGVLSADNGVTVNSTPVDFGTIAGGAASTVSFPATVAAGITEHRYVHFTLALSANAGAYTATRGFIGEIGRLQTDTLVTQTFAARSVDLYDEFHAWHYDFDGTLPVGHTQLVIETTSTAPGESSPDIDLLAKLNETPRYNITVGINPESPGFFCTSGTSTNCRDPATALSAGPDGDERVVFTNPVAGTLHIVIVNFEQLPGGMTYTLRAYTRAQPAFSDDGGRVPVSLLAAMLLAALARRSLRRA